MFNFSNISLKGLFRESEDLCISNPKDMDGNFLNTSSDKNLFENTYVKSNVVFSGQNTNLSHVFKKVSSAEPNPEDVSIGEVTKKPKATKKKVSRFKKVS